MQYIPRDEAETSLSRTVNQSLQNVLQHKLQKYEQHSELQRALGPNSEITPDQAMVIQNYKGSPETQENLYQTFLRGNATQRQQQAQVPQTSPLQAAQMQTSPMRASMQPQESPIDKQGLDNLEQLLTQPGRTAIDMPGQRFQNPIVADAMAKLGRARGQEGQMGQNVPLTQQQANQIMQQPGNQQQTALPQGGDSRLLQVGNQQGQPLPQQQAQAQKIEVPLTARQRAEKIKADREAEKEAIKEQHYIDKETAPFISDIDKKGGTNAVMTDNALNQMVKMIDSGELTGSTVYNFRKKMEEHAGAVGAGIGSALGAAAGTVIPGAGTLAGAMFGAGLGKAAGEAVGLKFVGSTADQAFTKLSLSTFLPRMKEIFGARVPVQEMQMFMDTVPSLAQTDEGKKTIIRGLRLSNDANRYVKQTKDRIIAENGGKIPKNLNAILDKATAPYLIESANKFREFIPTARSLAGMSEPEQAQ